MSRKLPLQGVVVCSANKNKPIGHPQPEVQQEKQPVSKVDLTRPNKNPEHIQKKHLDNDVENDEHRELFLYPYYAEDPDTIPHNASGSAQSSHQKELK